MPLPGVHVARVDLAVAPQRDGTVFGGGVERENFHFGVRILAYLSPDHRAGV
jgi:hypothetical protein